MLIYIYIYLLKSQWGLSGINNKENNAPTGTIMLMSATFLQCKKFPIINCDITPRMTVVDDSADNTPRRWGWVISAT